MTHRPILARPLGLAALVLLAGGCGGSGGGGGGTPPPPPPPAPVTVTIPSTAAFDGFVTNTTAFPDDSTAIRLGDTTANQGCRGTLRFSLASIPAGASLVTATLSLEHIGSSPPVYVALGVVTVDHVLLGAALDPGDYASAALALDVGVLSSDATTGIKTLVVTAQVAADLSAPRTNSDFRLHFTTETDNDGTNDASQFNDAEGNLDPGEHPTLIVTYQP